MPVDPEIVQEIVSSSFCSIVVPVFNRSDLTKRFLESFRVDVPHEIIVVDNGSTDDTPEILSRFPVKVLRQESNLGIPAALNRGIAAARGNFVTCVHNDVFFRDPAWLRETIVKLSLIPDAGVSGFCAVRHTPFSGSMKGRTIYCLDGLCMTFKKEVFDGFDERYECIGYYDIDACYSLAQKGFRSIVSWSPMKHENHATSRDLDWKRHVEENRRKFNRKWGIAKDSKNCAFCKKRLHASQDLTLKNCHLICDNCFLRIDLVQK